MFGYAKMDDRLFSKVNYSNSSSRAYIYISLTNYWQTHWIQFVEQYTIVWTSMSIYLWH